MSTASTIGQNLLQIYAEYEQCSLCTSLSNYIKGKENVTAASISCPDLLFAPHLTHIYDQSYTLLIRKVCQRFRKLRSWDCFLPSPDLLSQICSALYSVSPMARPSVVKNYGQLYPVKSTFFGGASNRTSTISCFL